MFSQPNFRQDATAIRCAQCGEDGPAVSTDAADNTYCAGCTEKQAAWDVAYQWSSITQLDFALGAVLAAKLTPEEVFRHVAARLEHADKLCDGYQQLDGGTLRGQALDVST